MFEAGSLWNNRWLFSKWFHIPIQIIQINIPVGHMQSTYFWPDKFSAKLSGDILYPAFPALASATDFGRVHIARE